MDLKMRILFVALSLFLVSCQENGEFQPLNVVESSGVEVLPEPPTKAPVPPTPPVTPVQPGDLTETFTQRLGKKQVDILWVIDDSGSMRDEQNALGYNFDVFIKDFINADVDFKMAITTTDMDKNGLMVAGSDEKLNSEKAKADPEQFKSDFRELVNVGIRGSGTELAFKSSLGFLEKYQTENSSFLRSEAYLVVVLVSDEVEQSIFSVEAYLEKLQDQKESQGLVKVYSICNMSKQILAARYKHIAELSGGKIANIENDFHPILSEMGNSIFELLDSFPLSKAAVPGSIKVSVDGVPTSDFSYDAESHSIKFSAGKIPPQGAQIVVTYQKQ